MLSGNCGILPRHGEEAEGGGPTGVYILCMLCLGLPILYLVADISQSFSSFHIGNARLSEERSHPIFNSSDLIT